jgi:hypothetical protein
MRSARRIGLLVVLFSSIQLLAASDLIRRATPVRLPSLRHSGEIPKVTGRCNHEFDLAPYQKKSSSEEMMGYL